MKRIKVDRKGKLQTLAPDEVQDFVEAKLHEAFGVRADDLSNPILNEIEACVVNIQFSRKKR